LVGFRNFINTVLGIESWPTAPTSPPGNVQT